MTKSILQQIGNTPLVLLNFITKGKVYAKLEYLNPGGSVKDRSALYMIEQAELTGKLKPGGTIVDASSGNQGIAMAMIGAAKGYKVIISVSEKISLEKLNTIKAYGAQIVMSPATDSLDHPDSYHQTAVRLTKSITGAFMPNQYYNLDNSKAHELSLGPEIWRQTNGQITHFIAAAGTGGTVSGAGRFLKKQNSKIQVIAVDSINSYRSTNGNPKPYKIDGMGVDFNSPVLDNDFIDQFITVEDKPALQMLKNMATQEGLLIGPSSGAVAYAATIYAQQLKDDDYAVVIFGDSGRAYLTKGYYDQDETESTNNTNYIRSSELTVAI
jgi:cystathionine beta-synthase